MSNLKCIIVEDEPLAVKVLSDYILQVPFLQLQGSFKDAILATEYLRDHTTDLIFLDIHLPKLKGMVFLKTLTHPPAVIITTAAFLSPGFACGGNCRPKREATAFTDWTVYSRLSSPVPGSPTTTPYPVSWLDRMPWKPPRSLIRSA